MKHIQRTAIPNPRWQAAVHGLLAALFAFVLPFVCWGVLETPGHPHGSVHFVFGQPPTLHASLEAAAQSRQQTAVRQAFLDSWCGDPAAAPLAGVPVDEQAATDAEADAASGRSVPSTAISDMPLLAGGAFAVSYASPPSFSITLSCHCSYSAEPSVPTPPPRAAA